MSLSGKSVRIKTPKALVAAVVLVELGGMVMQPTGGEIYRWDNGQVLPGTIGIWPTPGSTTSTISSAAT